MCSLGAVIEGGHWVWSLNVVTGCAHWVWSLGLGGGFIIFTS